MKSKSYTPDSFHHPFKDLKKLLKKRKRTAPPVDNIIKPPADDDTMFMDAMKDVQEIREFRKLPLHPKKGTANRCMTDSDDREAIHALEEIVQGRHPVHLPDTPEYIEWVDKDYRDTIAARLHKGHYAIQDCLDLHGAVLEDAEVEIDVFIKGSLRKCHKCIKIIHGRGLGSSKGPVLKEAVVSLLSRKYRKHIAAFVSARQCDGGLGAVYILLK